MGCDTKEDTKMSQTNGKQIGEITSPRPVTEIKVDEQTQIQAQMNKWVGDFFKKIKIDYQGKI